MNSGLSTFCDNSHSKICSASGSAWREISTRKAMLVLHVVEEFFNGTSAAGFCVVGSLLDTLNRLLKILPFPFQIRGESFVESVRGRLPALTREFFQFFLSLRF